VADIVEMLPYSRFNRGHHYILTVIDVLSKYAWAVPLKSKSGSETVEAIARIIRESGRHPKNLQTDMGKEFYNADVQRLVKKHESLFDVFGVKGIGRRAIQSHAEEQHVEDVYTQRKLQVDRRAAASRVRLQRAQASNDRHATRRRHARGRRKTLDYGVQSCKDRRAGKVQSRRFGTREQVQDHFREGLHAKLDHRGV